MCQLSQRLTIKKKNQEYTHHSTGNLVQCRFRARDPTILEAAKFDLPGDLVPMIFTTLSHASLMF